MNVLDSGERREFETGAVRDIQAGKGRCDLLPLDEIAVLYPFGVPQQDILTEIQGFILTGYKVHLRRALKQFIKSGAYPSIEDMVLELSKHFEDGCVKYSENNWKLGINTKCYIDSALRHYFKYLRGDKDEPHDRAFCWNLLCCMWTCANKPELNDFANKEAVK